MKKLFFIVLFVLFVSNLFAQNEGVSFPLLGKVKPRSANEIASSNWSVGAETMDRDLVNFKSWKDYIGPLGTKQARLQAGWAKCEKEKGVYEFQWLDEIIDHLLEQGVEPWLQTSYGNPIYKGGGGIHLSAGFPSSEEALTAWDNWVRAMAIRYKGRVKVWEIWNEPDNKGKNSAKDYAALYIRTAEIIRSIIPDATLYALSLASVGERGRKFTRVLLDLLKQKGKLDLVDDITLHGYSYNPSDRYPEYQKMYKLVREYSDRIRIRQGELGCPSENQSIYALKNYDWTELSQSKWVVRKMMGDLGRDIPSSYFLIIDIVYTHDHEVLMDTPKRNTKGLIKSDLDRNFVKLKPAFYSYQNVTSIFDNTLERIPNYPYLVESDTSLAVFAYRLINYDQQAVAIWIDGETPTNSNKKEIMTFKFPAGNFPNPVYLDLRTGHVYEIPKKNWSKQGSVFQFHDIPVYDSPILIADKSLVLIKDSR